MPAEEILHLSVDEAMAIHQRVIEVFGEICDYEHLLPWIQRSAKPLAD